MMTLQPLLDFILRTPAELRLLVRVLIGGLLLLPVLGARLAMQKNRRGSLLRRTFSPLRLFAAYTLVALVLLSIAVLLWSSQFYARHMKPHELAELTDEGFQILVLGIFAVILAGLWLGLHRNK